MCYVWYMTTTTTTAMENRQKFQHKSIIKAANANAGFQIDVAFQFSDVTLRNVLLCVLRKRSRVVPLLPLLCDFDFKFGCSGFSDTREQHIRNWECDIVLSIVKVTAVSSICSAKSSEILEFLFKKIHFRGAFCSFDSFVKQVRLKFRSFCRCDFSFHLFFFCFSTNTQKLRHLSAPMCCALAFCEFDFLFF